MGLATIFEKAVETVFSVFKDFIKDGKYIVIPTESGWGDEDIAPVEFPMVVITNGLKQKDLENTSFYTQIQPNDIVVMIKGIDITSNSIDVSNSDQFNILYGDKWKNFTIEAHETDPAEALYTVLLRGGTEVVEPVIVDPVIVG